MALRTILIADDEESISHALTVLLAERGYDALVTDVRMKRLDGLSLVRQAQQISPETTATTTRSSLTRCPSRSRGRRPGRARRSLRGEGDLSVKRAQRVLEVDLIRRALERTAGNRTRAAELLELSPRALLYKIRDYGLE